mgnify:CR=1 FL=1
MTDRTQPDAGSTNIIRYALELGLLWIDGSGRDKVREALDALDALDAQLAAISAGGVSGPLIGRAALSANAGEPVAWQYRSLPDVGGVWFECSKERAEQRAAHPDRWEVRPLYAAPPIPAPPIPKGMFTADEMEAAYRAGRQDGRSIPLNADDSWLTSQTRQFVKERTA